MTLSQMRQSEKVNLSPADVAEVLGCKPYSINVQAKADIGKLRFPAYMMGTRVKIPRLAFIAWAEGMKLGEEVTA